MVSVYQCMTSHVCISTEVDPVGSAWCANLHPTPTIELIQGLRGDAGCMAKARLFVTTGAPVQPHDGRGLDDLPIKWRWATIPQQILTVVGLVDAAANPEAFKARIVECCMPCDASRPLHCRMVYASRLLHIVCLSRIMSDCPCLVVTHTYPCTARPSFS